MPASTKIGVATKTNRSGSLLTWSRFGPARHGVHRCFSPGFGRMVTQWEILGWSSTAARFCLARQVRFACLSPRKCVCYFVADTRVHSNARPIACICTVHIYRKEWRNQGMKEDRKEGRNKRKEGLTDWLTDWLTEWTRNQIHREVLQYIDNICHGTYLSSHRHTHSHNTCCVLVENAWGNMITAVVL